MLASVVTLLQTPWAIMSIALLPLLPLFLVRTQDGEPLTVVPLPMPEPVWSEDGDRLPASYANFYIANRVVCVPVFGDRNDAKALRILRRLFPKRTVVPIRCEDLVVGMGTLHCMSQQLPK